MSLPPSASTCAYSYFRGFPLCALNLNLVELFCGISLIFLFVSSVHPVEEVSQKQIFQCYLVSDLDRRAADYEFFLLPYGFCPLPFPFLKFSASVLTQDDSYSVPGTRHYGFFEHCSDAFIGPRLPESRELPPTFEFTVLEEAVCSIPVFPWVPLFLFPQPEITLEQVSCSPLFPCSLPMSGGVPLLRSPLLDSCPKPVRSPLWPFSRPGCPTTDPFFQFERWPESGRH